MSTQTIPYTAEELSLLATSASSAQSQRRPAQVTQPHLRIAQRVAKKTSNPLFGALSAVAIVLTILFAQLGLSIAVSQGAYETRALQTELKDLSRVERVLSQNADKLASPQNLAENALKLGMVQNTTPATLRLSDGAVLGNIVGAKASVAGNTVANSTLQGIPVVDANGLLTVRESEKAALSAQAAALTPVTWEGLLPAPQTH